MYILPQLFLCCICCVACTQNTNTVTPKRSGFATFKFTLMNLSMVHAFRSQMKNRSYALINLFGLTLGLTVSIFIFLYVQDELSYDRYLPGYEQVIRIQP